MILSRKVNTTVWEEITEERFLLLASYKAEECKVDPQLFLGILRQKQVCSFSNMVFIYLPYEILDTHILETNGLTKDIILREAL